MFLGSRVRGLNETVLAKRREQPLNLESPALLPGAKLFDAAGIADSLAIVATGLL